MFNFGNDLERVYFENARQYTMLWFLQKLVEQRHINSYYVPRVELENMIAVKAFFKENHIIHNFAELDNEAYRRVCADLQIFNEVGTRQDIYFMADESYVETFFKLKDHLELSWAAQSFYLDQWVNEPGGEHKEMPVEERAALAAQIKTRMNHLKNLRVLYNHRNVIESVADIEIYTNSDVVDEASAIVKVLDYLRHTLVAEDKDNMFLLSVEEYDIVLGIITDITERLSDVLSLAPFSKEKADFEELMVLQPFYGKLKLLEQNKYLRPFIDMPLTKVAEDLSQHLETLNKWVLNINQHSLVALNFYVKPKMLEQLNDLPYIITSFNRDKKELNEMD